MDRRHRRIPYLSDVSILWDDTPGHTRYMRAKCLDISEAGICIEAPKPIPVHTRIHLRADRINVAGSATVKYVVPRGSKHLLGLELSDSLGDKARALTHEPWALSTPQPVA
jgi:hypothetical protein